MDEFRALNLRDVGAEKAIHHVIDTNQCVACIHFTNNDHNLLLGFSIRQILLQCRLQLNELLGVY